MNMVNNLLNQSIRFILLFEVSGLVEVSARRANRLGRTSPNFDGCGWDVGGWSAGILMSDSGKGHGWPNRPPINIFSLGRLNAVWNSVWWLVILISFELIEEDSDDGVVVHADVEAVGVSFNDDAFHAFEGSFKDFVGGSYSEFIFYEGGVWFSWCQTFEFLALFSSDFFWEQIGCYFGSNFDENLAFSGPCDPIFAVFDFIMCFQKQKITKNWFDFQFLSFFLSFQHCHNAITDYFIIVFWSGIFLQIGDLLAMFIVGLSDFVVGIHIFDIIFVWFCDDSYFLVSCTCTEEIVGGEVDGIRKTERGICSLNYIYFGYFMFLSLRVNESNCIILVFDDSSKFPLEISFHNGDIWTFFEPFLDIVFNLLQNQILNRINCPHFNQFVSFLYDYSSHTWKIPKINLDFVTRFHL